MYIRTRRKKCKYSGDIYKNKSWRGISWGTNFIKEIEGDNDDMPKEESSRSCGKDKHKYEDKTDEVTENKEIEQENTEIAAYEDIIFWPQNCSEQLLVDLVTLGPKKFQNKDEPFVRWGNSPRVMLQHWFYKTMENGEQIFLLFLLSLLPEDRSTQIKD